MKELWTVWSSYEDHYSDGSSYKSDPTLISVYDNHKTAKRFITNVARRYNDYDYEMCDISDDGRSIITCCSTFDDGSYTKWIYQISSIQVDYDES